jgi:hypothetical protein
MDQAAEVVLVVLAETEPAQPAVLEELAQQHTVIG